MKKLREVNGYQIVCDESDDIAINNHTWLENYCIDRKICEGCCYYKNIPNNESWICEKNEDKIYNGIGVIVGQKHIKRSVFYRKVFHNGMSIPENCDRKFEHTILTQEMDKID